MKDAFARGAAPGSERLRRVGADGQQLSSYRIKLHGGAAAAVEDFGLDAPRWSGPSTRFQVALPYAGLAYHTAGAQTFLVDATQVLFVAPERDLVETLPENTGAHRRLIITPGRDTLEELCEGVDAARHPCFCDAVRPMDARVRLISHKLLRLGTTGNPLEKDELATNAVRYAMHGHNPLANIAAAPRVVNRARELMHERDCQRMSLTEIAREVGVTPAYLTQEFTRSLGMPMYKYQVRLRLNRALVELPRCESITELALALGFSSHSHFTAAFKSAFTTTPSAFREAGVPISSWAAPQFSC